MKRNDNQRVVVTGMGMITPIGIGIDCFWNNAISSNHGIDYIDFTDYSGETDPILAGIIKDFDPKSFVAQRKSLKVMSRDMQIAVGAAKLAIEDAGINIESEDPTQVGVTIGAGMIHADINELGLSIAGSAKNGKFDISDFGKEAMQILFPLWLLKQLPNMLASHISIIYNAQAPSNTPTTASSAGLQAIGEASRIIERQNAKVYFCGGADCRTHPLDILKYKMLGLFSEQNGKIENFYCPYDKRRSGLIPGEAAGIFVIESLSHALERGAKIYGEIIGYGSSAGAAFREKDPEKRAFIESIAISSAIEDAGIAPTDIDYISGHGCSSVVGDLSESLAYKKAFGDYAYSIPVSSISSMVGYVGAATGSVNLATALMAINENKIAPTMFLAEPDPKCDLDYVPGKSRDHEVNIALVNTFDFSGQGAALVVKKFES